MSTHTDHVDRLRKQFSGPMSQEEVDFLRDVQGFIEFAIRNGLSFGVAIGVPAADINEISRSGFDLRAARASAWLPKVTGYSKVSADSVGEPEEPAE